MLSNHTAMRGKQKNWDYQKYVWITRFYRTLPLHSHISELKFWKFQNFILRNYNSIFQNFKFLWCQCSVSKKNLLTEICVWDLGILFCLLRLCVCVCSRAQAQKLQNRLPMQNKIYIFNNKKKLYTNVLLSDMFKKKNIFFNMNVSKQCFVLATLYCKLAYMCSVSLRLRQIQSITGRSLQ